MSTGWMEVCLAPKLIIHKMIILDLPQSMQLKPTVDTKLISVTIISWKCISIIQSSEQNKDKKKDSKAACSQLEKNDSNKPANQKT